MSVSYDVPGWTAVKRALLETRKPYGMHVVGWEIHRDDCGCMMILGWRLDKGEPTFGFDPCDDHREISGRVIEQLHTMPGQDRDMVELAAELFEAELTLT